MALLLDTCAVIWLVNGDEMAERAVAAIDAAYRAGEDLRYSPISAWEVGMLVSRGRLRLTRPPAVWFHGFASQAGIREQPLTGDILIQSSFLPGEPPPDPADRMVIASARAEDHTIVTRDRKILAYGRAGHARVLAC